MPPAPDTPYTLRGRLIDAQTGGPAPGLTVEAFDFDRNGQGQQLGSATTDGEGRFVIPFEQRAAGGRSEGTPEPFVVVKTADGRRLHQSGIVALGERIEHDFGDIPFHPDAGPVEEREQTERAPEATDPSSRPGSAVFHGNKTRDVLAPRSPFYHGPFGRLFRELPPWVPPGASDEEKAGVLGHLAGLMLEEEGQSEWGASAAPDNRDIPSGYTYFGQFVDHDITFDPASSLTKRNDPDRLVNFRTPRFDLDNLYGEGPDDEPFLYDRRRPGRFLLGKGRQQGATPDREVDLCALPKTEEDDLPRNEQGTALIGDPRNDENVIVSQLQLAFLKFHNRVMDFVEEREGLTGREAFFRAQQLVRWHYQWVVLFDFVRRICGDEILGAVLSRPKRKESEAEERAAGSPYSFDLRYFRFKNAPFMPVEFSVAAYRFGHSMVRPAYDLNGVVTDRPIFRPPSENPGPLDDLRGFRPLPGFWSVDWRRFFDLRADGVVVQPSRLIDGRLARPLAAIPAGPGVENPLALLNLLRGWRLELPSGQAVARAMGAEVIPNEQLGPEAGSLGSEAPLWFYVLKEAELRQGGLRLGAVGGRIVAEVFVGLAKHDPSSFFNQDPAWTPARATADGRPLIEPLGDDFELRDILRFAGLDVAPF